MASSKKKVAPKHTAHKKAVAKKPVVSAKPATTVKPVVAAKTTTPTTASTYTPVYSQSTYTAPKTTPTYNQTYQQYQATYSQPQTTTNFATQYVSPSLMNKQDPQKTYIQKKAADPKSDYHPVNADLIQKKSKAIKFVIKKILFFDLICILVALGIHYFGQDWYPNHPEIFNDTVTGLGLVLLFFGVLSLFASLIYLVGVAIHYHTKRHILKSAESPISKAKVPASVTSTSANNIEK